MAPSADSRQVVLGSTPVKILMPQNGPISFVCTSPECITKMNQGEPNMCMHLPGVFEMRLELGPMWNRIKELDGNSLNISVLISELPHAWAPLRISDIGLSHFNLYSLDAPIELISTDTTRTTESIAQLMTKPRDLPMDPIALIGPEDGMKAIREVLYDLWVGLVANVGIGKQIKCKNIAHGAMEQSKINTRLRAPNLRGRELMRQHLTGNCSACASRSKKAPRGAGIPGFEDAEPMTAKMVPPRGKPPAPAPYSRNRVNKFNKREMNEEEARNNGWEPYGGW